MRQETVTIRQLDPPHPLRHGLDYPAFNPKAAFA
jgi:hypothetical protein